MVKQTYASVCDKDFKNKLHNRLDYKAVQYWEAAGALARSTTDLTSGRINSFH